MTEPEGRPQIGETEQDFLRAPVRPVSLVNDIAERFRQAIINGTLRPGDEINESQLAESMGVARGTLREAVRILISEGLLEKLPNRASRVRTLSPEKIWEIMTARAVVESFGARVLAQRLTPDKVRQLNHICRRLLASAEAGNRAEFTRWDFRLHQAIMELSGHRLLFDTWTQMSAWVRLMLASEALLPADLVQDAIGHQGVIEAIISGDPDLAETRLKADLLDQKELERFAGLAELIAGGRTVPPDAGSTQAAQ